VLTNLEVFGLESTVDPLPLDNGSARTDPLQIKNIEGLGPVKANIATALFGAFDGEYYTGSTVGKRNIVITIGLNPNWATQTVAELRKIIYGYLMPKQKVRLRFQSLHLPDLQIDGYVESLDPNIFAKDPEVQISIICPDPYYIAVEPTEISGQGIIGSSDVLEELYYMGNVPTGFVLRVNWTLVNATGLVQILNQTVNLQEFKVTATINATSYLEISSVIGNKYAKLVNPETNVSTNILTKVQGDSVWPKLNPGKNMFGVLMSASSGEFPWTLSYFERFGGL